MYINFVELECTLLQAKFQYHRTTGSGGEDFKGFYHKGIAAILVM